MVKNAEPGDSGTLLHIKCHDGENKDWVPTVVFRGFSRPNSEHSTRRGIAAFIPPLDQFTWLKVVDLLDLMPHPQAATTTAISFKVGTKDGCIINCYLHPAAFGPRAIKLVLQPSGVCKYGVFVFSCATQIRSSTLREIIGP
jgi:hypothetical protein